MDATFICWSTTWRKVWSRWMSIPKLWPKPFIESWRLERRRFWEYWGLIRTKGILTCPKNQFSLRTKKSGSKNMPTAPWFTPSSFTFPRRPKYQLRTFTKQSFGHCTKRENLIHCCSSSPSCCIFLNNYSHEEKIE